MMPGYSAGTLPSVEDFDSGDFWGPYLNGMAKRPDSASNALLNELAGYSQQADAARAAGRDPKWTQVLDHATGKWVDPASLAAADPASLAIAQGRSPAPPQQSQQQGTPSADAYMGGPGTAANPQLAEVQARAKAQAMARLNNQTGGNSLMNLFGVGDGDWAAQFGRLTQEKPSLFGSLVGQQMAGPNTSSGLAGLFNNASGPYGQMQAAAAMTAAPRADERARRYEADTQRSIAGMKYGTAKQVASQLANMIGNNAPLTSIQTDYGAGLNLKPVDFRRFFTK